MRCGHCPVYAGMAVEVDASSEPDYGLRSDVKVTEAVFSCSCSMRGVVTLRTADMPAPAKGGSEVEVLNPLGWQVRLIQPGQNPGVEYVLTAKDSP